MVEWERAFREHISDYPAMGYEISFEESANRLRRMVKSGLLRNTDCLNRPERFLRAHNIMSEFTPVLGYGFFLRFTAHYNLFCVNVASVGTPEQVALLDKYQEEGKLGCFALTERFAGVNSGLIVNTICDWDPARGAFVLHTPDDGATKNWITAAHEAELCIVSADLRVGGKSHGAHAFVVELRKDGALIPGLTIGLTAPTGKKNAGNDLDNIWMHFDHVVLPKSALLSRYSDVVDGTFVQKVAGVKPLDMTQSLYSGRVEFAHSAIIFAKVLYANCRKYTDGKAVWAPKEKTMPLSSVPQLASLYPEAEQQLDRAEAFMLEVESKLCECLRLGKIPPPDLFQAICVSKVFCVELAIKLCHQLKEEVGAFALLPGCGFEHMDHLFVSRFVEGDSRILKQKISRDQIKAIQGGRKVSDRQRQLCEELAQGGPPIKGFELAELVCQDVVDRWLPAQAKL